MADFVDLGFELAFRYRNPVIMLSDGVIGQMMEKVELQPQKQRLTTEEVAQRYPWATTGCKGRKPNVITSVELRSEVMEQHNLHLQAKYREIEENEVRYEVSGSDKPVLGIVAFGSAARISQKVIEMAHEEGIEVQLLRPITLWPFPKDAVKELASKVKGILTVEINAGQMVYDVRYHVEGRVPVEHYGRLGGIVPSPGEILDKLKTML